MRRFLRESSGNMAVLFAVGFALAGMVAALAIDLGALYHQRRSMQNGVDLAAIIAAGNPADAVDLAQQSLREAGLLPAGSTDGLIVTPGQYTADPTIPPAERFRPGVTPFNAVAVTLRAPGALHFAKGWLAPPTLGVTATASMTPRVSFSIGSRLASFNGGIANGVLNALLGSNISLTALDYQGLVGAKVDLFDYLDALAARLNVTAGTYDDLLDLHADHGQLASALSDILTGTQRAAALTLALHTGHNGTVPLSALFQLGDLGKGRIGKPNGVIARVSALDLLAASATVSNGSRQVGLNLTSGIPGLVGIETALAVGEPMQGGSWYALGEAGATVRTAQVRLRLVATVLGSGALLGVPIRLPLYAEIAQAEAVASTATCPTASHPSGSARVLVRPGALRIMIGEVNSTAMGNFGALPVVGVAKLLEVRTLGITVLQVLASSLVDVAQTNAVALDFTSAEIAAGTLKTARTSTMVSSLTGSLLGNMRLQAPVLGLGLNLSSLSTLLKAILMPVTPTLDLTINRLLNALGLSVGEADVTVHGVHCSHAVLVG